MSRCFIYDRGDILLISNGLHALVHVLKTEGVTRRPNRPYIYASLFSTHLFFE